MTPLFAPRPAPRGIGFGPGHSEQVQSQGQAAWSGNGVDQLQYGGGGWAPWTYQRAAQAWQPPMPPVMPTPQSYGWGSWGAQTPYGVMPAVGAPGQGFGGFDPYAQQQIAASGFGQPWTGQFR